MAATSASSSTLGQILNIHISHSGEEGNSKMSELYNTLIKDHDIQSLSLKVANHGCITSGNPFAFSFQLGDSFSPLATLRLDGYDFDSLHDARSTWYRLSTTGIHGWRRYITHEYSYEWLRPERIPLNIDKRSHVWKSARNQEAGAVAAMVARERGPSQNTRLEVREWESEDTLKPRPVLSQAQLMKITSRCPELRELSIDIDRNGTWPIESLSALSTLENLHHLEINLELGIDQHIHESSHYLSHEQRKIADADYRQPIFHATSGTKLFEGLRQEKKGKELEKMTVTIGDWGRTFGGGLRITGWGEGLEESWVCKVNDDGKEGCEKVEEGCCGCMRGWEEG